jgi:hypothetical protein
MLPSIYSKRVTRALNAYNRAVNKHEEHRVGAFNNPTNKQYNRVARKLRKATRARKVATSAQHKQITETLKKLHNARMKTSNRLMYNIYSAHINKLSKNLERI